MAYYFRNCIGSGKDTPELKLANQFKGKKCQNLNCGNELYYEENENGNISTNMRTGHLHSCNEYGTYTGAYIKAYYAVICASCNGQKTLIMRIDNYHEGSYNAWSCDDVFANGTTKEKNKYINTI